MKFDPACAFLLDLGFENLYEPVDTDGFVFRCKGCRAEVERRSRQSHWSRHRAHRQQYAQARKKEVQQATAIVDEAFDRALGDFAESPNGRPEGPVADRKEAEMPASRKKTTASRPRKTAASPSKARSATETKTRPKTEAEKGTAILASLYKELESELGTFEKAPNDSGTYTRLRVAGKAFAYVFTPRENSVGVKIPKQLLHVESGLPKGHPFRKTKWGLTATAKSSGEVAAIVKGLKVAHAAVTPDEDAPTAREAAASN